ncbi:MAG: glycosyltransferase [Cetobacterium sp.]|uniref:glycosyltransferase n=1 Tax=Cetobacterium sp. TaxID=2071632 RepID=UPI003F2A0DF6
MKKIVFNTDSLIMGGAEKIALDYVNLLKDDYKILLLVNEDNGEGNILKDMIPENISVKFVVKKDIMDKLNLYRKLKKRNVFYKLMYSIYLNKRRKSYKENITKILKDEEYDFLVDFYCKIPQELVDSRTICWLHMTLENLKERIKIEYQQKFKKCKNIIVLNEAMRNEVKENFKIDELKIEKIYNFFDLNKLEIESRDKEKLTKIEKELIEKDFVFACCRIDKQKDLDTLIDAYQELREKYKRKEKLYIAGEGDQKERLENYVRNLGLENEIVFLGTQKNPYVWMKSAKFFIHSSHREGFGMVLVEGLITNGLVISTDCPVGPSEILESGKSGILVPLKDKSKMSEEMNRILIDKELEAKIKKEAKRRCKDFSKEKILQEVQRVFRR